MKEKSLTTSDEVHGQYRSFKRIWDEEGTDMQGYQAFREQSQTTLSASIMCTVLHLCFA